MNFGEIGAVAITSAISGAITTGTFYAYDMAKKKKKSSLKSAIFAGAVSGAVSLISGMIAVAYYNSRQIPPQTAGVHRLGQYMPAPRIVTYDNTVLRRYS